MSLQNDEQGLLRIKTNFLEPFSRKVEDSETIEAVLARVVEWAGEQQILREAICTSLLQYPSTIKSGEGKPIVDQIVQTEILDNWQTKATMPSLHLKEISDSILTGNTRSGTLLKTYLHILQRKSHWLPVHDVEELVRIGVVRQDAQMLGVSNAVYAAIFDLMWVKNEMHKVSQIDTLVDSPDDSSTASSVTRYLSAFALLAFITVSALFLMGREEPQPISDDDSEQVPSVISGDDSEPLPPDNSDSLPPSTPRSDRELYDDGLEDAKSARWVDMAQSFCKISEGSEYLDLAQNRLEIWKSMNESKHQESIELAFSIANQEGGSCPVSE